MEHGPAVAGYDNLGQASFGHPVPFIECLCGWRSNRIHERWMTVGEAFDDHLRLSTAIEEPKR